MATNKLPDKWDEATFRFFEMLVEATSQHISSQTSMYDLGERIGVDRNEASRMAETIMAEGWAEVRTLSGDIGLTQNGLDAYRAMGSDEKKDASDVSGLGTGALLEADSRQGVDFVVAGLKRQIEKGGFEFDLLSELVADIRTLDAQMASPRPKTAILRACFKSILGLLASTGKTESMAPVKRLLL